MVRSARRWLPVLVVVVLVAAACSDSDDGDTSSTTVDVPGARPTASTLAAPTSGDPRDFVSTAVGAVPYVLGGDTPVQSSSSPDGADLHVGAVFFGQVNAETFNLNALRGLNDGLRLAGATPAGVVEVTSIDDERVEAAVARLVGNGSTVVIAMGAGFDGPVAAVAGSYPDVHFVVINGTTTAANLSAWSLSEPEAAFLVGALLAIRLGPVTVGYTAYDLPFFEGLATSLEAGIGAIEADGDMVTAYAPLEAAAQVTPDNVRSLVEAGADVLYTPALGAGVVPLDNTAAELGVPTFHLSPNRCLAGGPQIGALGADVTRAVTEVLVGLETGRLTPGFARNSITEPGHFVVALCGRELPADELLLLQEVREQIVEGTIDVPGA